MAATITQKNGLSRAIERDPCWLTWEIDSGTAVISAVAYELRELPAGTNILSAYVQCIEADAGATSTLCTLKVDTTNLLVGAADNGGVVNVVNDGVNAGTGFAPSSAGGESASSLNAVITTVGGSITNGAVWRIMVLVNRNDF